MADRNQTLTEFNVNKIKELHLHLVRMLTAPGDTDEPEQVIETGLSTPAIKKNRRNVIDLERGNSDTNFSAKLLSDKLNDLLAESYVFPTSTFTTFQLIEQVHSGTHITRCLQKGTQNMMKGANSLQKTDHGVDLMLKTNYKKVESGLCEVVNQPLLKKQKQVLGYIIKQFGSALVTGKSIGSLSLPVTIFEPRSLLERTSNSFLHAPQILEKGAQCTDALEQFRHAVAFHISTLFLDINPEKPFNPILGETFQAIIGGDPIYVEQVSHHPPVCAYQMVGKNYNIHGLREFTASISSNSVKSRYYGYPAITFKNTGNCIQCQNPIGLMSGTSFGKRTYQYTGMFYIFDFKNKLYCEIDFECSESSLFKKSKYTKDYFTGKIWKTTDKFMGKLENELKHHREIDLKFKEKDHSVKVLDTVEGSWLQNCNIGDKTYWSFGSPWPYELQYFDNPLPSDSNYRQDILYMRAGDENKAQEAKVVLEERQRADRKLKEQTKSKNKK
jgi:hypothetical protein